MSETHDKLDEVMFDLARRGLLEGVPVQDEAQEVDAAAFLLHVDERAQALHEAQVVLEQDEAAEKLRHERKRAELALRQKALDAKREELRREVDAHRRLLLPGKAKSRALPSGLVVAYRNKPRALKVDDAEALLAWCKAHPLAARLVRTKTVEEPAKAEVDKVATMKAPPGCHWEDAREDFDVKAAKGGEEG